MILIVDFGSQTAHLIGRRLRQLGITTRYAHPEDALNACKQPTVTGIILSGGPANISESPSLSIDTQVFSLGLPMLGICYGWQLIAHLQGGTIKASRKEYGPEKVTLLNKQSIFDLPVSSFMAIMSHGDTVTKLPKGFTKIASTKQVAYAAVANKKKNIYGVQFHPEADHTEFGIELLTNFAKVCGEQIAPLSLNPQSIIEHIKQTVGNKKVISAVSGGVDSTVATYLIAKAIGKHVIPVYVESGLMRSNTEKHVRRIFSEMVSSELVVINAKKRFLDALAGITEPEKKRKIIGQLYVEIFQEVAKKHADATYLGQGTIYSDVIESKGSKHASHIKSHHNVGGLPKDMHMHLLEPLRNFYKDEVREIGLLAGLPQDIVMQQPWPGPGHAVNIMGEVTKKRLAQVIQADEIVTEEMKKANLYTTVFECFAVMTGAYSTAVKGDSRVYAEVVAVRSYNSKDIMTAEWTKIPHDVLAAISSRIVNEVPDVSRVVYDITSKPPATMRWE